MSTFPNIRSLMPIRQQKAFPTALTPTGSKIVKLPPQRSTSSSRLTQLLPFPRPGVQLHSNHAISTTCETSTKGSASRHSIQSCLYDKSPKLQLTNSQTLFRCRQPPTYICIYIYIERERQRERERESYIYIYVRDILCA